MKGFLAAALALMVDIKSSDLEVPLSVILTADEEVGCKGAHSLSEQPHEQLTHAFGLIVGEPTESKVVVGHKRKSNYSVAIRTRPEHSSVGPYGVNAIDVASSFLSCVRSFNCNQWRARNDVEASFRVPVPWINVGKIGGGTAANTIADTCDVVVEVRVPPAIDPDSVMSEVWSEFQDMIGHRYVDGQVPRTDLTRLTESPGFEAPDDSRVAIAAMHEIRQGAGAYVDFGTEAGVLGGHAPTIVWGPGSIDQAHGDNEWLDVLEYESYIRALRSVVSSLTARSVVKRQSNTRAPAHEAGNLDFVD